MKLKKLIKKINKENAPPGGWREGDKLEKYIADRIRSYLLLKSGEVDGDR
jgi:hypothetical protein